MPNAAVQLGATGPFVYVVKDDDTVAVRKIDDRARATRRAPSIASGLQAGDKVVIDGVDRLRDGAKVQRRGAGRAARAGAAAPGAGKARRRRLGAGQHRRHAAMAPTAGAPRRARLRAAP